MKNSGINTDSFCYLASPFFNESQLEYISGLENLLEATEVSYYSPRQHGDTSKIEVPEYLSSLKRDIIFNSNIEAIDGCDTIIVNLRDKDIGTSFEYGYAVGRNQTRGPHMNIVCIPEINISDTTGVDCFEEIDPSKLGAFNEKVKYWEVNVKPNTTYGAAIGIIQLFYKMSKRNKIHVMINTTNSEDNYCIGVFLLGAMYKLKIRCSYISPITSKSNLMITQSGIKQYNVIGDYPNNPVVYDDKDIR